MSTHPPNERSGSHTGRAEPPVSYDEQTETYRTEFDAEETTVVEAVLSSVAAASERTLLELPLLYDAIDIDALATICSTRQMERSRSGVTVAFEYAGYQVRVFSDGFVTARSLK